MYLSISIFSLCSFYFTITKTENLRITMLNFWPCNTVDLQYNYDEYPIHIRLIELGSVRSLIFVSDFGIAGVTRVGDWREGFCHCAVQPPRVQSLTTYPDQDPYLPLVRDWYLISVFTVHLSLWWSYWLVIKKSLVCVLHLCRSSVGN